MRLVGYIVPRGRGAPPSNESLENHLAHTLIPAHFVSLAAMPLTGSGKVDRKTLPARPARAREPGHRGRAAHATEEVVAARTWRR